MPLILRIEASGPGAREPRSADSTRRLVISSAASSISTLATRAANSGSSISGRPSLRSSAATRFKRASSRLATPMPAMLVRSWPSRNLAYVQPRFSSPIRFSTGTRTFSNAHFVDLMAAVEQLDRTHAHARAFHVDQQERNAGLLFRLRIGAHQAEDPIGVLAERVPGLLAIDEIVIALAHRARAQRGQIRAGARLRIPLAPPRLARADGRQKALLLRGAAERDDHGRDHLDSERNETRRTGVRGFLLEDVLLHGVPAGAAELHRPAHGAPAAFVQAPLPQQVILAAELIAVPHLVANVLR